MFGSSGCVSEDTNEKANHDKSAGMSRDRIEKETRSLTPGDSLADSSTCLIDNIIDASGMCLSCNDVRALDKSISWFMCLKQFHAICREDGGFCNNIDCNKTFLDQFNKRIEKNSLYEGNFLFVCSPCKTNHEHKDAASLQSHVHCLERKVDSMESSLTEIKSLLRQPATDNTSPIHTPQTQNPTPPINIWNDSIVLGLVKCVRTLK